jgi:hypothetical protein
MSERKRIKEGREMENKMRLDLVIYSLRCRREFAVLFELCQTFVTNRDTIRFDA